MAGRIPAWTFMDQTEYMLVCYMGHGIIDGYTLGEICDMMCCKPKYVKPRLDSAVKHGHIELKGDRYFIKTKGA